MLKKSKNCFLSLLFKIKQIPSCNYTVDYLFFYSWGAGGSVHFEKVQEEQIWKKILFFFSKSKKDDSNIDTYIELRLTDTC